MSAMLSEGFQVQDVKFLGVISSINEQKKFGMVSCEDAQKMWQQDIYAFKGVLESCGAGLGDTIRFGIHVNPKGQPQVSLPVWKIGPDGLPIGVTDDVRIVNCEEFAAKDPNFLTRIKMEVEGRSSEQNAKRSRTGNAKGGDWQKGKSFDKGKGKGDWGGWGDDPMWGPWGKGKGWEPEVTLYIGGLPADATRREVSQIFRQYAGFSNLRLTNKADHSIAFVSFQTMEQAYFVAEALASYVFDEEAEPQSALIIDLSKESKGCGKGDFGKGDFGKGDFGKGGWGKGDFGKGFKGW